MEKREQDLINRLNAFEYDPDKNGLEVYEGELDTAVEISISLLSEFIDQELDKAREEVERKFVEKYHKRGKEMNVPYSEEDGKEFWQGYKEGYNQGLKDMIVDTYYLDKEFELKLKQ